MIAFTAGPRLSVSSMRCEYFSTNARAVNLPEVIPSCSSAMVISSSSKGATSGTGDVAGRGISRAPLKAGRRVTATPAAKLFCKNPRRDEPELDEGIVSTGNEIEPPGDY